jgi:hypothetical protein
LTTVRHFQQDERWRITGVRDCQRKDGWQSARSYVSILPTKGYAEPWNWRHGLSCRSRHSEIVRPCLHADDDSASETPIGTETVMKLEANNRYTLNGERWNLCWGRSGSQLPEVRGWVITRSRCLAQLPDPRSKAGARGSDTFPLAESQTPPIATPLTDKDFHLVAIDVVKGGELECLICLSEFHIFKFTVPGSAFPSVPFLNNLIHSSDLP